jgi:MFS transporter, ACS family, glucarate transporter
VKAASRHELNRTALPPADIEECNGAKRITDQENVTGGSMSSEAMTAETATGRVRFTILTMLFCITVVNYADRATLSIAGPLLARDLGISAIEMGFVFSAFGWSYVIGQIPGGRLLDRFGSKMVYFWSILLWSVFTFLQGGVSLTAATVAIPLLFGLRLIVGFAEAPSFPANSRIVAAWFPDNERGTAAAIFNSAQYFATVLFAPLMGWIAHALGWQYIFFVMGGLGVMVALISLKTIYAPRLHPRLSAAEFNYIRRGNALVEMDNATAAPTRSRAETWVRIQSLLRNRMMLGIFLGQYCISTLTYFFLTWFPVYLVQQRGMSILQAGLVASIPAICGFAGGVLGGIFSDALLRRGFTLTVARKTPIVIGLLLSSSMVLCNYVDVQWLIVTIMALAFFGKGIGALGWAVMSDTAPPQTAGLSAGLFNMFGNIAAISTPIVIGYIIGLTGSFNGALLFVGANALVAVLSYVVIVGEIKRLQ